MTLKSTAVWLRWAVSGDQRFADNTVDEKMLERARRCISRVPDIYIDVLATRFDRAREVVDMLLSGQKLEADQEAYLLVMLEGKRLALQVVCTSDQISPISRRTRGIR